MRDLGCDDAAVPRRPSSTCDVSFIGLAKALPPALACAAPGWRALVLVKPQFEAGPAEVGKGGVVRDPAVHRRVVDEVAAQAPSGARRVARRGRLGAARAEGKPGVLPPPRRRELRLEP